MNTSEQADSTVMFPNSTTEMISSNLEGTLTSLTEVVHSVPQPHENSWIVPQITLWLITSLPIMTKYHPTIQHFLCLSSLYLCLCLIN